MEERNSILTLEEYVEGGHDIPRHVIIRRFYAGLKNLIKLYIPVCDYWMIFDNSKLNAELVAEGYFDNEVEIRNIRIFETIKAIIEDDQKR